jgi:hypothetical protein
MSKGVFFGLLVVTLALPGVAFAQKDTDNGPTCWLSFVVTKDESGKPVRNAAVIMHPVNPKGKQVPGGAELKTDLEGKTSFDGIPYGKLRVQVLAHGFQTYGEDFEIDKPKIEIAIKLKRPTGQYSIYDDHPKDPNAPPSAPPAPNPNDKKPN